MMELWFIMAPPGIITRFAAVNQQKNLEENQRESCKTALDLFKVTVIVLTFYHGKSQCFTIFHHHLGSIFFPTTEQANLR